MLGCVSVARSVHCRLRRLAATASTVYLRAKLQLAGPLHSGSLYESQAALRLAAAWGYVSEADAERSFEDLEAFGGRLYGLIRR